MLRSLLCLGCLAGVSLSSGYAQTKPTPRAALQMRIGILVVSSDHEGLLFVDGDQKAKIAVDKVVRLELTAGQHFVDLRDASGSKFWSKVVNVPAGAQVAETIAVTAKSTPVVALEIAQAPELTSCEERFLLGDNRAAATACNIQLGPSAAKDEAVEYGVLLDQCQERSSKHLEVFSACLERINLKSRADTSLRSAREIEAGPDCAPVQSPLQLVCRMWLYAAGEYEKALSAVNSQLDEREQDWRELQRLTKPGSPLGGEVYTHDAKSGRTKIVNAEVFISLGQDYSYRSLLKYALGDRNGALTDLTAAFERLSDFQKYYSSETSRPLEQVNLESRKVLSGWLDRLKATASGARLERSVMLYRLGRYQESLADFNEFAAYVESVNEHLGPTQERLRSALREAGQNQTGPSQAARQQDHVYTDLKQEIEAAQKSGGTVPLPESAPCESDKLLPAGVARYEIKNSTTYDLRIVISGPVDTDVSIRANSRQAVTFPAGAYRILGKVSSPSVLPFLGQQSFVAGSACASEFYVGPSGASPRE
jgi:tetratricopeptide (TPR) repeat protein